MSANTGTTLIGGIGVVLSGSTYANHSVVTDLAIYNQPTAGGASDTVMVRDSSTGIIKERSQADVASVSDERLKKIINPINNALSGILQLNGYEYEFNDKIKPENLKGQPRYGLIAQETEIPFPHVVKDDYLIDKTYYKSVKYNEIVPILVEAIKELKLEIDQLKK